MYYIVIEIILIIFIVYVKHLKHHVIFDLPLLRHFTPT